MAINFPQSQEELFNRISADIKSELPNSNPQLRNSFLRALTVAYAGRSYDVYQQLKEILKQAFPDTATGEYLRRHGGWVGIDVLAATRSQGYITLRGVEGTNVPVGTEFQDSLGNVFSVTESATVSLIETAVSSIERSGNIVTVTTAQDHNLGTGIEVTISGANQADYNGTHEITVTATDEFIYTIDTTPTTPATGTITVASYTCSARVESEEAGAEQNKQAGETLTITSPIAGLDNEAVVQFAAIGGGTDEESDDDYRIRVLYEYQNPVALFNEAAIVSRAKKVNGVTRVFVQPMTPYVGATTVYFTRDNDDTIIPEASEMETVRNTLLEILPCITDPEDLIVAAPTPVPVNITFTNLTPNTTTMQDAIRANLEVYFKEQTEVGLDIIEAAYTSVIYQTVDLETGDIVEDFALSAPSGDVAIASDELAVLGTVSFSIL